MSATRECPVCFASYQDHLSLPHAGRVNLDNDALDEAIARLRRGEVREALYQLEKAMDGQLRGLSDIKPEHLK